MSTSLFLALTLLSVSQSVSLPVSQSTSQSVYQSVSQSAYFPLLVAPCRSLSLLVYLLLSFLLRDSLSVFCSGADGK